MFSRGPCDTHSGHCKPRASANSEIQGNQLSTGRSRLPARHPSFLAPWLSVSPHSGFCCCHVKCVCGADSPVLL